MKKRIFALFTALILTLLCLPFTVFAEDDGKATQNAAEAAYELDDFARWGVGEEYAIVPCNAGGSCVDEGGAKLHIWRAHRKNNQIWTLVKV
ncbi:MAG: hypothetical protein II503_04390, partial [Clostridia bacterium]|nr:hypothetical protein [Clostridia bacterium]